LVIGTSRPYPSLDPTTITFASPSTGGHAAIAIMGSLLTWDSVNSEIRPGMAESIETEDGQTWTLTLREGVEFTDGTPYDAAAVIFNLERFKDPETKSPAIGQASQIVNLTE